jgi:hypothetical protein
MRHFAVATLFALMGATLLAGEPEGKGSSGFDKLKALVGVWQGTTKDGKPVQVSYKLVSAGTSLMETLDMGEQKENMITMYHLDGDNILMTHYCSMGNEPRMRASASFGRDNTITFKFVDVANLAAADAPHMHGLVFTLKDKDHIAQQWTMRAKGKDESPTVFDLTRTN